MNSDMQAVLEDYADAVRGLRSAIHTKFDELDKNVQQLELQIKVLKEIIEDHV